MPRQVRRLAKMTARQREVYERALHAVSLMRRHKMPIGEAAREAGTTPTAVTRYAGRALKRVRGRWVTKPRDQLERRVVLYDVKGSFFITVRSSTTASRIGDYHNAVRRFVPTGDDSKLRAFAGKYVVDAEGRRHYFLTDPETIRRLARAGEFRFESIY